MNHLLIVFLTVLTPIAYNSPVVTAERILVISFIFGKSLELTYRPLLAELGRRGHNITNLTPITTFSKLPNVTEVPNLDMLDWERRNPGVNQKNFFQVKENNEAFNPFMMVPYFKSMCEEIYEQPIIQQILKEDFDLVFMQHMFNDCALGLVHRLKAPLVLFSPVSVPSFMVSKLGGHHPPSVVPNLFLGGLSAEMGFLERFKNFGVDLLIQGVLRFYFEPAMTAIYREKLGEDIPPAADILANASLILSNGHFSVHKPKPHFPDVVEVGGLHSHPPNPLPQELESFISKGGKHGFIVFSMGTAIKGSSMSEEKRKQFLSVFSKLKQQVLWKWETGEMEGLPKNVKLSKWLPQQDLLGHKDIKMFITHCGGGSLEESIYHGVPLVGFPMFGDQPLNAKLAKDHGFIVELEWNTVTEDGLMAAIQEVLTNPIYRQNVKRLSELYKDQPDEPLKRAVYWVEYVMRHKGAMHLRSAGRSLNYFQYHSYDVILAYLAILYVILRVVITVLKFIFRKCCGLGKRQGGNKSKRE